MGSHSPATASRTHPYDTRMTHHGVGFFHSSSSTTMISLEDVGVLFLFAASCRRKLWCFLSHLTLRFSVRIMIEICDVMPSPMPRRVSRCQRHGWSENTRGHHWLFAEVSTMVLCSSTSMSTAPRRDTSHCHWAPGEQA